MNCPGLATRKEHSIKAGFNKARRVTHSPPLLAFIQCVVHSSQIPARDRETGWGHPNSCLQPLCWLEPQSTQRQGHMPGGPRSTEQKKSPEIKLHRGVRRWLKSASHGQASRRPSPRGRQSSGRVHGQRFRQGEQGAEARDQETGIQMGCVACASYPVHVCPAGGPPFSLVLLPLLILRGAVSI